MRQEGVVLGGREAGDIEQIQSLLSRFLQLAKSLYFCVVAGVVGSVIACKGKKKNP